MQIGSQGPKLSGLGFRSPPSRAAKVVSEEASEPFDQLDINRAAADRPKPVGYGKSLLKWGVCSVMAATTLIGAIAGAGVATNADVLKQAYHQEKVIYPFDSGKQAPVQTLPGERAKLPTETLPFDRLQESIDLRVDAHKLRASLPQEKSQAALNHLRNSETVQTALAQQLRQAESEINTSLESVQVPGGETLLTARVPFPSGDGSLVQVGGVHLPVGLRKLAMEELPLVLSYELAPLETGVSVGLQTAEPEEATLPTGVKTGLHLGTIRADLKQEPDHRIPLSGRVRLELDNGEATRRALLSETDPDVRAALVHRLEQIEKIQELSGEQNLEPLMDLLTENRVVEFQGHLKTQESELGQGRLHAWLTPDRDADQRADLQLTGELSMPVLDKIEFVPTEIKHGDLPQDLGMSQDFLQAQIAKAVESAARKALPSVVEGLREPVKDAVHKSYRIELSKVESQLDQVLDQTLDAAEESASGLGLKLGQLQVDSRTGELTLGLNSDRPLTESLFPKVDIRNPDSTSLRSASFPRSLSELNTASRTQTKKPALVLPQSTVGQFASELLKKPEVQKQFQELTRPTRERIEQSASRIPGRAGSVELELEAPFPTDQNVESPLGALPILSRKKIPLSAKYRIEDFGTDLQLDLQALVPSNPVRPEQAKTDGVFLGAVRVKSQALETQISGELELSKGQTKGGAPWAETALDEAFAEQNFEFKTEVTAGDTDTVFYIWAVPDQNGDGPADVAVAHKSLKTGVESLRIQMQDVRRQDSLQRPRGSLGAKLNQVVGDLVEEQLENSSMELTSSVARLLEKEVKSTLDEGSLQVAQGINRELKDFYSKVSRLDIPLPADLSSKGNNVSLNLGQVRVNGDRLITEYSNAQLDRLLHNKDVQTVGQDLKAGEFQVHLPGEMLNSLLAQKSQGGTVDWNKMLREAAKKSLLIRRLELAKDSQGRDISPSIQMVKGKPTLVMPVDGKTVGLIFGSRLDTEIQVPLKFELREGTLSVNTGKVTFKSRRKGNVKILDILPTRILSRVVAEGMTSLLGPNAVKEAVRKADLKTDLSDFGMEWTRVQVKGNEGASPDFDVSVKLSKK